MAAPARTFNQPHRPVPVSHASSHRDVADELVRYRLQVVAANIADAVLAIGGLIFDRAMAGWDVSVSIDGDSGRVIDDRPVRILGARLAGRLADANDARALPRPHMVAVATDVMVRSDAVRRHVLALGNDRETEVLLWGRHHPTNLSRTFVAARHQPSAAAHVFKAQALVAGGARAVACADEGFYSMA